MGNSSVILSFLFRCQFVNERPGAFYTSVSRYSDFYSYFNPRFDTVATFISSLSLAALISDLTLIRNQTSLPVSRYFDSPVGRSVGFRSCLSSIWRAAVEHFDRSTLRKQSLSRKLQMRLDMKDSVLNSRLQSLVSPSLHRIDWFRSGNVLYESNDRATCCSRLFLITPLAVQSFAKIKSALSDIL